MYNDESRQARGEECGNEPLIEFVDTSQEHVLRTPLLLIGYIQGGVRYELFQKRDVLFGHLFDVGKLGLVQETVVAGDYGEVVGVGWQFR